MTIASSAGTGLPPIPSGLPPASTASTTQAGGAAPAKGCSDPSHTSGGGATDASVGAANALGGGDAMAGISQALRGIVEALSKLMASLSSGATGGGPATKGGGGAEQSTASFLGGGAQPAAPDSSVAGASGGGAPQKTHVGGERGGPVQQSPVQKTEVAGERGGPGQVPTQKTYVGGQNGPGQVPTQKTQVGGQNGPGQSPTQSPIQTPLQKSPTQVGDVVQGGGAAEVGDVKLHDKGHFTVLLESSAGNSVKIYSDPHVKLVLDGKTEKFDIGYGPGGVELRDGTRISWDTTERSHKIQNFRVDRPGTQGDVEINAADNKRAADLETFMTDDQLREFAGALREYQGDMRKPLTARASTPG